MKKRNLRNLKTRKLSIESLENRELLSVTPLTYMSLNQDNDNYRTNEIYTLPALDFDVAEVIQASQPQAAPPVSLDDTFKLHSKSNSRFTIYLDFNGHTTIGTLWNNGATIVTPAYTLDANPDFNNTELERIQYIWQRVAEDFIPFDVDVTTEEPNIERLIKTSGSDTDWGIRVVIGGSSSDWYNGSVGGVAYLTSFDWSSDTPCFVFPLNLANGAEKTVAECISHEVGHTLGLSHDGGGGDGEYYGGANGWAPIMGVGYSQNLVQWSKGEYSGANNTEDDLNIITTQNGFTYRNDDHGNTSASATQIIPTTSSLLATGIIERNTDIDFFKFELTMGMSIDLSIVAGTRDANLDILAKLYNSSNTLIYTSDPQDTLNASILVQNLSTGIYYLTGLLQNSQLVISKGFIAQFYSISAHGETKNLQRLLKLYLRSP